MKEGLTTEEVRARQKLHGKNEIITHQRRSAIALFLSQFPTLINGILAVASVFSFFIQDLINGIFIFVVLVLNSLTGFIQEYKAEKALEKLSTFIRPVSRVIRNNKEIQIPTVELVPGDIVILSEGDRIPADGYFANREELEIDESILTGESLPVAKRQNDKAFNGTLVVKGKGRLTIERIGMQTRFGQIANTLSAIEEDKTPLRKRLDTLGKTLSIVAASAALLLLPIGILQGKTLFPLILLATSIAIAAIPEGLPTVVTIALAIGTNRMAKKNAIVRKMSAVETLGAVQVIIVDKTGTLTQNAMQVKKYWTADEFYEKELLQACVFGNTASLVQKESGAFDVVGDRTDSALLLFAKNKISDINSLKAGGTVVDEFVFDPKEKTITTVWQKGNTRYVFVRGAPEAIVQRSTLSDDEKNKITQQFESYAKEGLRVIGFGSKQERHDGHISRNHLEKSLRFLGIVGIYDPPRPQVKEALAKARSAGIHIVMVTGDNELTALTIARETGMIEKDEEIITGAELVKMSDGQLLSIIDKTRIFARSQPEDKLRLVNLFKQKGLIVGVTGDGVNDALALKRADVGVAMGQTGTDVAKQASDIVITDDNFATLMHAVEEGRIIYHNILKAVTYLLAGNLSELSLVLLAAILGMPNPLLPTQILWINLVTDTLPALALASDTKDPSLIKRPPRHPKAPILTSNRIFLILTIGFSLAISLLVIFNFLLIKTGSEVYARTVVFNLLIASHLGIAFVVRGGSFFRMNKFLVLSILGILALQAIITITPFFQNLFHLGF